MDPQPEVSGSRPRAPERLRGARLRAPERLRGARPVLLGTRSGAFEALEANHFGLRLRGLAGLDPPEILPLLIPRCASVHTFGMRAPIDVAWVDVVANRGHVLAVDPKVPPRRFRAAPRRAERRGVIAALELPAGTAAALGIEPEAVITMRPLGRPRGSR